MSDRIAIGILRKSHGVRGEASVEPWTSSADRFGEVRDVFLVSPDEKQVRPMTIAATREHGGRALVKFAGIESPEALQPFYNWTVEIPESEARELGEDEYYLHDLVGLTLVDAEGATRGTVLEVYEGGGGILLSVRGANGNEYELPFAADICVAVDLAAKTMTVALPEGLEDLDAVAE